MTAREVIRRLEAHGATRVRQKGSHAFYRIQKDMAPCYGEKWLLS
jgi:predicted RNA binding protein YcfA (HicA-like mRNA interferase family)